MQTETRPSVHNGDVKISTPDFKVSPSLETEVIDGLAGLTMYSHVGDDNTEISESLLSLFQDEDGQIMVHKVLAQLKRNGIKPFSDIRLESMMLKLSVDPNGLFIQSEIGVKKYVSKDEFKSAARDCVFILNQALSSNLVIPDFPAFAKEIKQIYDDLKEVKGGKNADYIPQLSRVNPNYIGESLFARLMDKNSL